MKNMNCVSTMPEIMPEITDEACLLYTSDAADE